MKQSIPVVPRSLEEIGGCSCRREAECAEMWRTLWHEVLRELVEYRPHEGLVLFARVALLAEDAREASKQVVPPVQVSAVLRVAYDALQHPQVFVATLQ
ncbi:unnamed protein product, partial [Iphiclides podalirius]